MMFMILVGVISFLGGLGVGFTVGLLITREVISERHELTEAHIAELLS